MKGRIVGIDLGTSNSCVAAVVNGEPVVIPDREGWKTQPSVVSFLPDGRTLVGRSAKNRLPIDPMNTIYSAKRLIGRPFYSPEVKVAASRYGYKIAAGGDDTPKIVVRDKELAVEEIQALVLRHMKTIAEQHLGEVVNRAIITVPANFNEAQRQSTVLAGQLAGLDVERVLNEPTAAALAYGSANNKRERIAVYDFGGGTFDITVLELRDHVFEVRSTAGDSFLGGDDFDFRIVDLIVSSFQERFNFDIRTDRSAMQRLKALAEQAKIDVSEQGSAVARIAELIPGAAAASEFDFRLDAQMIRQRCADLVQQTFGVCDEALKLARISSSEIDRVVLVGGSTKSPLVREMAKAYFFKEPFDAINPDEVIAVGAAIYARGLDHVAYPSVNIPGGIPALTALLLDVTPHALGIETVGGIADSLILRNSAIPTRSTRTFVTSRDDQETVRVNVLEGESRSASECRLLGVLTLTGLRRARRGQVAVEVTFEVKSDGMLHVRARDKQTGRHTQTILRVAGVMSDESRDAARSRDLPASADR
jgi:molecular chaperone DnaK